MMVPEPMRPGWDKALAMSASRIPYRRLVTIDQRIELAAAKPVITPDTVVIDHGRVFLSEVFQRAAATLGISVQPAHQQTGTDKAAIERTFESINTLFCQHVAGYTGRDVTRRGAGGASQELLVAGGLAGASGRMGHSGVGSAGRMKASATRSRQTSHAPRTMPTPPWSPRPGMSRWP